MNKRLRKGSAFRLFVPLGILALTPLVAGRSAEISVHSGHPSACALAATATTTTRVPVNARQGDALLYGEVLARAQGSPCSIIISLGKQRAWLMVGDSVAIDTPIASGRKPGWTPTGAFSVMEKDPNHHSNKYGDLVDASGSVVRKNVTAGASGGIFRGAPMKWFLRLNEQGVGMHAGFLPGYPASHGCIRLPKEAAERLYRTVSVGTPVIVTD